MLGVLGGSGVYGIDGLTNTRWKRVDSPFGSPSDELFFGELDGSRWCSFPVTDAGTAFLRRR